MDWFLTMKWEKDIELPAKIGLVGTKLRKASIIKVFSFHRRFVLSLSIRSVDMGACRFRRDAELRNARTLLVVRS